MTVQATTKLLDEFGKVSGRVARPRTFMEIAGYPHYENVCSNILAFFMDPEEPHGLGPLMIDALMSFRHDAEAEKIAGGSVSVEREVVTDKGRIDVLITSDDHVILIENKIHASVSNPFDDYAAYLDRIANDREKYKFLLTLSPTDEGNEWGFTNLTHEEFVGHIRLLLGHYLSGADTRYLTIFLDFLSTLENLRKGTRLDPRFIKLLADRSDEVEHFLAEIGGFRDELRKKVRELGTLIDVEEYFYVGQRFYRTGMSMYDCLVHDIQISRDLPVYIDTTIYPDGWEISFGIRGRDDRSRELRDLLQQLAIPFEDDFAHPIRFAYSEDPHNIGPVVQDLVGTLAMSQEHEE